MDDDTLPANVLPGTVIGPTSRYLSGRGTHVHDGQVVASLLGRVLIAQQPQPQFQAQFQFQPQPQPQPSAAGPAKRLTRLNPARPPQSQSQSQSQSQPQSQPPPPTPAPASRQPRGLPTVSVARSDRAHEVLPSVGNTVLCRVSRLLPRQANVSIELVGDTVLQTQWQGVIRSQDVRSTEKDRVRIDESFRPGDVVRAQVISLGDQSNYYLSTASNELGVVMATSEGGNDMVPLNWKEYGDPVTGEAEARKVAKPSAKD